MGHYEIVDDEVHVSGQIIPAEAESSRISWHKKMDRKHVVAIFFLTTLLFGLMAWVASSPSHKATPTSTSSSVQNCGSTPAEARNLFCRFDLMAAAWVPPECYNEELSESFLRSGNWTWYEDREATCIAPIEKIREGNYKYLLSSNDFHLQHCLYNWQRLLHALHSGKPLDSKVINLNHTEHCSDMLYNGLAPDPAGAYVPFGHLGCASYEVWKQQLR